jgi:hypothetical protein
MKIFKFESGNVNLFLLSIVVSIFLFVLGYTSVKAWNAPTVTSLCAPNEDNFSFKVTLSTESNYNMEWSFDSGFTGATSTTLNLGDNTVTVPREKHNSGDIWYIRFVAPDHATGSANTDGTLCNSPTPTNTPTATPTATPTPTPEGCGDNCQSPTPTPTATPVPTSGEQNSSNGGSSGAPVCNATKPGTPTILSAVQNGTSVTLIWSAVPNATYYSIVYGRAPGYQYGVANIGNVTTYTINSLNAGVVYHFAVNAVNDCMPGDPGTFGGGTGGQVLGASTMAGTGSFEENLYLAIMVIGGTITAFGLKNIKKAFKVVK